MTKVVSQEEIMAGLALAARIGDKPWTSSVPRELWLLARTALELQATPIAETMLAWARFDREADDLAARLDQAAELLTAARGAIVDRRSLGIRVALATTTPEELDAVAKLEAEVARITAAFRRACELEHEANETIKTMARAALDAKEVEHGTAG